jgi:hypothetical protein
VTRTKVLDTGVLRIGGVDVTSTPAELNAVAGLGDSAADFTKLHAITAAAADVNLLAGMAAATDGIVKVAKVALANVDTGGGVFAWANPEAGTIIIHNIQVYVTTIATGACSLDIGTTATNATTQSDTLIDGLDVHTATGVFSVASQVGVNGAVPRTLATGKWVTASKDSGASAGLVGFAYIHYILA